MIKVAHITTIDLSLRLLLLNQLRAIQYAGYEVVGISTPGPHVGDLETAGIRHIPVQMTRTFSPVADAKSLRNLVQVLRREQFDIVHTHNPKPGLLGQLAARFAGVPIVVNTLHGFYFHDGMSPVWRRFYIATETIAAACSDVIFSQNLEDMDTAVTERITNADKLRHLGNGIDLHHFDPKQIDRQLGARKRAALGIQPRQPVVGFVGRLVAEKGILEFLAAARLVHVRIPEARFLIIGPADDEKTDALTPAIAEQFGLGQVCIFTGMRSDMPDLYALMDVFVLPSHREGFPRSPMEASAMAVPSVVTNIRGCRETVEHGRTGWLTPLGDVRQLADAISVLLGNPQVAAHMGRHARLKALREFDERLVFNRVLKEYDRLIAQKLGVQPDAPVAQHATPAGATKP